MPWDILWKGETNDLEFAPNMDLSIVGGDDLIQQRMLVRLRMMRGWIYDSTGELGSNLYTQLSQSPDRALESIPALVFEALSPMSHEITVEDVLVHQVGNTAIQVIVEYRITRGFTTPSPLSVTFPLT